MRKRPVQRVEGGETDTMARLQGRVSSCPELNRDIEVGGSKREFCNGGIGRDETRIVREGDERIGQHGWDQRDFRVVEEGVAVVA